MGDVGVCGEGGTGLTPQARHRVQRPDGRPASRAICAKASALIPPRAPFKAVWADRDSRVDIMRRATPDVGQRPAG